MKKLAWNDCHKANFTSIYFLLFFRVYVDSMGELSPCTDCLRGYWPLCTSNAQVYYPHVLPSYRDSINVATVLYPV